MAWISSSTNPWHSPRSEQISVSDHRTFVFSSHPRTSTSSGGISIYIPSLLFSFIVVTQDFSLLVFIVSLPYKSSETSTGLSCRFVPSGNKTVNIVSYS